jgi:general secretion pathway protein G
MKLYHLHKRFITLVEMMIVMFLIAMITGVIAYNYTGSLEEGKAFKTKAGMEKIKTILALDAAASDLDNIGDSWKSIIANSPLVQNPKELMNDGWGVEYVVRTDETDNGKEIVVISEKYKTYLQKKGKSTLFGKEK